MRQATNRQTSRKGAKDQADDAATGPDLYEAVTARIIGELEAGRFPWVQPWGLPGPDSAALGLPYNALTGRSYSGINILILWGALFESGYGAQGWITFRQALSAGGHVRRGERGVTVVYADRFIPEAEKERALTQGGEAKAIPFLKRFTVFNVDQCEGLVLEPPANLSPLPERDVVPLGEAVIAASGVDFRIGGSKAYYAPATDVVQVPPQTAFFEQINYYRTCLHELTHATGHAKRLNRTLANSFGSKDYAREELVAEMGSAFLCAALGIMPTVRHADYLGAWLDVLREDNRAIVRAASQASKAADWLLERLSQSVSRADLPILRIAEATPPELPPE
ncbi:MAG: DUF1738 domain-containing protein [Sphingomonas sp.]|nr:DUF1738 domain-containing protein [Sphingomonas sp.]